MDEFDQFEFIVDVPSAEASMVESARALLKPSTFATVSDLTSSEAASATGANATRAHATIAKTAMTARSLVFSPFLFIFEDIIDTFAPLLGILQDSRGLTAFAAVSGPPADEPRAGIGGLRPSDPRT